MIYVTRNTTFFELNGVANIVNLKYKKKKFKESGRNFDRDECGVGSVRNRCCCSRSTKSVSAVPSKAGAKLFYDLFITRRIVRSIAEHALLCNSARHCARACVLGRARACVSEKTGDAGGIHHVRV